MHKARLRPQAPHAESFVALALHVRIPAEHFVVLCLASISHFEARQPLVAVNRLVGFTKCRHTAYKHRRPAAAMLDHDVLAVFVLQQQNAFFQIGNARLQRRNAPSAAMRPASSAHAGRLMHANKTSHALFFILNSLLFKKQNGQTYARALLLNCTRRAHVAPAQKCRSRPARLPAPHSQRPRFQIPVPSAWQARCKHRLSGQPTSTP